MGKDRSISDVKETTQLKDTGNGGSKEPRHSSRKTKQFVIHNPRLILSVW